MMLAKSLVVGLASTCGAEGAGATVRGHTLAARCTVQISSFFLACYAPSSRSYPDAAQPAPERPPPQPACAAPPRPPGPAHLGRDGELVAVRRQVGDAGADAVLLEQLVAHGAGVGLRAGRHGRGLGST